MSKTTEEKLQIALAALKKIKTNYIKGKTDENTETARIAWTEILLVDETGYCDY